MDAEGPGGFSKYPWYAIRQNYISAVVSAGGLPFLLAHEPDLLDLYLSDLDGLIITGGSFDVDPELYGESVRHETVTTKPERTHMEMALLKGAMEQDLPVLGICGGQQLLHVALGGTLVQHIPDEGPDGLAHEQPNPRHETGHDVKIEHGTLLHDIIGFDEIKVNSAHHQAVRDDAPAAIVNARAPDGIIEGIEARELTFCLGVQWHPEFEITNFDTRLYAAFVDAARTYAREREAWLAEHGE